jgi:[ribosomal protein S5]-alanine N-acetyltransferase
MFFLATMRLKFRCWTAADLPLANLLWGDAAVTRFIGTFTPETIAARLSLEIEQQRKCGVQYWPMFVLDDERFVGCCGLRPYRDIYELGFHLRPAFWGQGIAMEASRAVIKYGWHTLGAPALFAGHHPENLASKRVLEKLGFVYTHDEIYPPTGLMNPGYRLERE